LKNKKWKANVGLNPSLFFRNERMASGEELIHTQRNLTFESAGEYQFTKKLSMRLTYLQIHAFDRGALSGNFIDAGISFQIIRIPEIISINMRPDIFYFNFKGKVDGVYTSNSITIEYPKLPLSLYFQSVIPLWTDFPVSSFRWNTGLAYAF
jgi:hypothetical protein